MSIKAMSRGLMSKFAAHRLQILIKTAVIVFAAAFIFQGSHPPLNAQKVQPTVPVITVTDAVQDEKLQQLDAHITATDARVQRQAEEMQIDREAITGFQVEERVIGAVLAFLSSAGLIIQVKKAKTT